MPSHLDTIRKIHARATAYPGLGGMFPKIDNDLEEEAGMDGNLQRLLQSARDLDNKPTEAPAPAPKYRLRCTFIPQAWVNNYAVNVDPAGPTTWDTDWFGTDLPAPRSDESDQLRDGADAPRWVKDWSGPFEVEYEVIPSAAETPAPAPTAHTPEPWATRRNDDGSALAYEITVNHGKGLVAYVVGYNVYDGTDDPETEANAVRIVAAVNACAGITDPGPTLASIAGFLEDVVNGCDPDEARTIAAELLALLGAK